MSRCWVGKGVVGKCMGEESWGNNMNDWVAGTAVGVGGRVKGGLA